MTGRRRPAERHAWLALLQQSGPFLTLPVADQTWPTGLPAVTTEIRGRARAAVAELLETSGRSRSQLADVIFGDALCWQDALVNDTALPASLSEIVPEYRMVLRPDFAFFFESEEEVVAPDDLEVLEGDETDSEADGEDGEQTPARSLRQRRPRTTHGSCSVCGLPGVITPSRNRPVGLGSKPGGTPRRLVKSSGHPSRFGLRREVVGGRVGAPR